MRCQSEATLSILYVFGSCLNSPNLLQMAFFLFFIFFLSHKIMMNAPRTVRAARPARTPTGHTAAAALKDTSCSLTGFPAEPDKVSGIRSRWKKNGISCLACKFHFY